MSINFNSPASYLKHKFNSEDISKSATAGDTRVENAILYGNANLLKAMDMAETLEGIAKYGGAATRVSGQQAGLAAGVAGAADAVGSLALGALKRGHLGGSGGAEYGEIGTSGSELADFGYTPAEDIAFNNGTGVSWSTP